MARAHLESGTVVGGDFRVVEPLGAGGMGSVYVAEQLSTGKKRALKVMHAELAGDEKQRERFVREAKAGSLIDSSHVVEVIGAGVDDDGHPWLAMELLRGNDLAEHLSEHGPLSPAELEPLFEQLCHALAAAHASGVVHRDIKPENIFMATTRGARVERVVKVLDFGIAKLADHARTTRTAAIGSPSWMAPEQAEPDIGISPATDVWALGLLAYWLLTGRVYWRSAQTETLSMHAMMKEVLLDPLDLASKRAADQGVAERLPEGFDAWFERCVHREPRARFSDAGVAFESLHAVLEDGVLPSTDVASMPGAVDSAEMSTQAFLDSSELAAEDIPLSKRAETDETTVSEAAPESQTGEPSVLQNSVLQAPPKAAAPDRRVIIAALVGVGAIAAVAWLLMPRGGDDSTQSAAVPTTAEPVAVDTASVDEPPTIPDPPATAEASTAASTAPPADRRLTTAAPKPTSTAATPSASASASASTVRPPFNRRGAQQALGVRARTIKFMCKNRTGPRAIEATVTFSPDGGVQGVAVTPRSAAHSPTGQCVRIYLRQTRVPPFDGEPESVPFSIAL